MSTSSAPIGSVSSSSAFSCSSSKSSLIRALFNLGLSVVSPHGISAGVGCLVLLHAHPTKWIALQFLSMTPSLLLPAGSFVDVLPCRYLGHRVRVICQLSSCEKWRHLRIRETSPFLLLPKKGCQLPNSLSSFKKSSPKSVPLRNTSWLKQIATNFLQSARSDRVKQKCRP